MDQRTMSATQARPAYAHAWGVVFALRADGHGEV
jgi:hypothetical protein